VLNVDQFITELRSNSPRMAFMMTKIVNAINQTANAMGVDSTSFQQAPQAPQAVQVKAAGGIAHVTITDSSQRSRALNYFVEHDTDPNFTNPHVAHLVASRGVFLNLPAFDDNGDAQPWHFRAYSMLPGSKTPSAPIYFGSAQTPTPVNVGGTTQLTPLTSTGSGTASTTGQQGLSGFGRPQFAKTGIAP
jgi:hypothetical protein